MYRIVMTRRQNMRTLMATEKVALESDVYNTYRRPVPLKRTLRRSPAEPREIAGGINGGKSGGSLPGSHHPRRSHGGFPRISAPYGGEVQVRRMTILR